MKRRAVFFDRDNTLIACDEFLGDPGKVVLIDGAAEAVARARSLGYVTVTVSNQSGVARGYFSEEAVHAVNSRLDEMLADANHQAIIDRHEFCPYHPDASIERYRRESEMRKPAPGMILSAAEALALDLENSWVIGDAPRDIAAAKAAGCRAILFRHPDLKRSPAADAEMTVEPDYIVSTLREAMDFIAQFTESLSAADQDIERPPARELLAPPEAPSPAPAPKLAPVAPPPDTISLPTTPIAPPPVASPAPAPEIIPPPQPMPSLAKLESLAEEILRELRRSHEELQQPDFSVSKLFAGIAQIIVIAVLFIALINRAEASLTPTLLFALTLQAMTIALLIMSRQQ